MSASFELLQESVVWVADTGLFIACGRQQNNKYVALERLARRNGLTFVVPRRVYDELGGAPDGSIPGRTPIDSAIDAGRGAVSALSANGFEDRVRFKDGFELIDEIT